MGANARLKEPLVPKDFLWDVLPGLRSAAAHPDGDGGTILTQVRTSLVESAGPGRYRSSPTAESAQQRPRSDRGGTGARVRLGAAPAGRLRLDGAKGHR